MNLKTKSQNRNTRICLLIVPERGRSTSLFSPLSSPALISPPVLHQPVLYFPLLPGFWLFFKFYSVKTLSTSLLGIVSSHSGLHSKLCSLPNSCRTYPPHPLYITYKVSISLKTHSGTDSHIHLCFPLWHSNTWWFVFCWRHKLLEILWGFTASLCCLSFSPAIHLADTLFI